MVIFVIVLSMSVVLNITLYRIFTMSFNKYFIMKRLNDSIKKIKPDRNFQVKILTGKVEKNRGIIPFVQRKLLQASLEINPIKFLVLCAILCTAAFLLIYLLTNSIIIPLVFLAAFPVAIDIFLNYMRKKRLSLLVSQLSDVISFLSSSLRSGYSFMQALSMVSEEGAEPVSSEFKQVIQDINMGKSYEEAFKSLVERNPIEELDIIGNAVIITRETGGNLSHIFDIVSDTLKEKNRLKGQIKSLTAQGRLSGIIISLVPIGLLLTMYSLNPEYVKVLFTDPLGILMLSVAGAGQIIGAVIIRNIINIDW